MDDYAVAGFKVVTALPASTQPITHDEDVAFLLVDVSVVR